MPNYYVLVKFSSEVQIADPAGYVADAVTILKGSYEPSEPEFTVDRESVEAMSVEGLTTHTLAWQ